MRRCGLETKRRFARRLAILVLFGCVLVRPGFAQEKTAGGIDQAPACAASDCAGASLRAQPQALSRGVESLVGEIRNREFSLEKRARELARREASVGKLEHLIDGRLADLQSLRGQIEQRIEAWSRLGGDRVAALAKLYSAMPPEKAASLLSNMDLDLSVEVVRKMKQKQGATLLAAMSSKRAVEISRRMVAPLGPRSRPAAARPR